MDNPTLSDVARSAGVFYATTYQVCIGIIDVLAFEIECLRTAFIGIDDIVADRTAVRLVGMSHGGGVGCVQPSAGSTDVRDSVPSETLTDFAKETSR